MKLSAFLKDRSLLLLLHVTCLAVLAVYLHITGYSSANITLICILWLIILAVWLFTTYLQRKKYFREAAQILENMDKPYLLSEVLPDSYRLEDKLYREMLRRSNKSVIEKIYALEDASQDYREYLESWVHEIKAPITGIALLCENGRKAASGKQADSTHTGDSADYVQNSTTPAQTADSMLSAHSLPCAVNKIFRDICLENNRIENYVDMVLYLARSGQVYKDYLIRETDLQEVIYETLEKERFLLIQNEVQAEVSCPDRVFTDRKWIAFIINQLILNSVKYRGDTPVLRFYTHQDKNSVTLTIEDNGTGILPEDLPRIFEKGFTGSNGRNHKKATGMGLYLCRKLCCRLGIALSAQSEYGKGTRMLLTFPLSSHIMIPFYQ